MGLTNQTIMNAQAGETLWDRDDKSSIPGLQVRIHPTGKRVFMYYYRTKAGKQRRPKIGEFGDITIAEARRRAKAIGDRVAIGEDPKGEWEEAKEELLVRELYERVLTEHWDTPRYRGTQRLRDVKSHWKCHLEHRFGHLKLSELDTPTIKAWHKTLENKRYVANRSLEVLSVLYTFAEQEGLRAQNTNPCRLVPAFPEKKRKRFAAGSEITHIIQILNQELEVNPRPAAFLFLLLFTGARPSSIERATYSDLTRFFTPDGEVFGRLVLAGKTTEETGEDDEVLLPPRAMEIIELLPGPKEGRILNCKMPRRLWARIREEVGCTDLRARDFRRTFASIGRSSGVKMETISGLLNHKTIQTTMSYAHLFDAAKIEAVSQISKKIGTLSQSAPEK